MTSEEFRRIALSLDGSEESSHHGHPDFRCHGKIFATLGYPDAGWAMVRLTAPQQARFTSEHPECIQPVKGAWGRRGATNLNLFAATPALARRCLALAHRNVASATRGTRRPAVRTAEKTTRKRAS